MGELEWTTALVVGVAFFAGGFVKGAIGFALPLIAVSGAAAVLPAQTAVALVILPALVSNVWQAFGQGLRLLLQTFGRFWLMNSILIVMIWVGAGFLPGLDDRVFFAALGAFIAVFATIQLAGWRPKLAGRAEGPVSFGVGAISGFCGGVSGIWGPPVVLYLVTLGVGKAEQMRATGLSFLLGAMVLTASHIETGVLNEETAMLSAAAVVPTLLGQIFGRRMENSLDLDLFRRITLFVLCAAAVNLLRRAMMA